MPCQILVLSQASSFVRAVAVAVVAVVHAVEAAVRGRCCTSREAHASLLRDKAEEFQ